MVRLAVLAQVVLLLGAQGCNKQRTATKKQPIKNVSNGKSAPGAAKATPAPAAIKPGAAASTPGKPAPEIHTPLKTQLGNKATGIKLLGWLDNGERFVIRTWRTPFVPGPDTAENIAVLRLTEVHETITSLAVRSFRIYWTTTSNADGQWGIAYKEARPKKEWQAFAAANKPTKASPSRVAPDGRWSLVARSVGRPRGFRVSQDKKGVSYSWDLHDADTKKKPSVDLFLERKGDSTRIKVLRFQVPLAQLDEEVDPAQFIHGEVRPYWTPDGKRVVLLLGAKNDSRENPEQDARFYVRSIGPQVQLTSASKDPEAARRQARWLARSHLPVARLKLDDKPRSETLIYFRGAHRAQAEAAAKVFSRPCKIEELKTKGWLHLIILQKSGGAYQGNR